MATTKEQREQRKNNGLCSTCGKNPAINGKLSCQPCINKCRNWYEQKKKDKFCVTCGINPSAIGKFKCQDCLDKYNQKQQTRGYAKEWREQKRKNGICISCGKNSIIDGMVLCQNCYDKRKQTENERYELGLCKRCGKRPFVPEGQCCQICLDDNKNGQNVRKIKRKENGLCITCGNCSSVQNIHKIGSVLCETCYLKSIANHHGIKQWQELRKLFNHQHICPYTHMHLILGINASLDHSTPTCRGGTNEINNLQWVYARDKHFDINKIKGALTDKEFRDLCKLIINNKLQQNPLTFIA